MSDPVLPAPVDPPALGNPIRVVVEVISSADVARLEARDDDLRSEIRQLRSENEGLRRSFYELLEVFGDIKRSRYKK